MAQYDLLLGQNVAPTGTEFSEVNVNLPKGALLSGSTGGTPIVLAAGAQGYMLIADSAEPTGLKWVAVSAGHTQNTDTGTTNTTFAIDSDGYNLPITAESASKLGIKVAGGATYADFQAKDATFNKVFVPTAPTTGNEVTNKTYVDGLLASLAGAMLFKGNIFTGATGNDITPTNFNTLATYNAGWQYRANEAGTFKGFVCEIGDILTATVTRAGSGNVNADWTVSQTNIDGAVSGPVSATDNYPALFSGSTGKLIKAGTAPLGTAAYTPVGDYATAAQGTLATNAIPKGTITAADQIVYGTAASTPAVLTVGASTFVGKKAAGGLSAMTPAEARTILNVADGATNYTHPTTAGNIHLPTAGASTQILQYSASGTAKWVTVSGDAAMADNGALTIGAGAISLSKMANVATGTIFYRKTASTGSPEVQTLATLKTDLGTMPVAWVTAPATKTSTGTEGQLAKDNNFLYLCTATNVWKRSAIATNW